MINSFDWAAVISRLEQLETARDIDRAEIAELRARDKRREQEHTSLLQSNEAMATGLRRSVDEDYMLLGQSIDARIAELSAGFERNGEGGEATNCDLQLLGMVRQTMEFASKLAAAQREQAELMSAGMSNFEKLTESVKVLADTVKSLQAMVGIVAGVE